ncbi:penicillin-binding protein 2 [Dermacoccus sp. PAMC28757]|uniref:peptidoglycan D,D-transpeptidase FtsI family protein n=1 Tax=Dermacoccus sp. PAMC28757 TaxID=2762331 RepID=UPI00164D8C6E|nr:penicillin-binding transpeptidase domain-containing protein [Dermacoccus sp. PAMC28757]QNK53306.1 penicillin-binding protein 2 [Dermacoccus sp. PAMC28757]
MNTPIRRLGFVVAALFCSVLLAASYIQVLQAKSLNNRPGNTRIINAGYKIERGSILVDGKAIATSRKSNDKYVYERQYTNGSLYAPVTGYNSLVYGNGGGLEGAENEVLTGTSDSLFYRRLVDVVTGKPKQGANLELTINPKIQQAAAQALGNRRGAVVALDPKTGAVLAMVTSPSYDPNNLASHDTEAVTKTWTQMNAAANQPMVNRTIGGTLYPPGSTFKLVTSAAALESGNYSNSSTLPGPATLRLPQTTHSLPNDDGRACGPNDETSLLHALEVSCNTAYAQLGMDLGQDKLASQAKKFGFGDVMRVPMRVTPSTFPTQLNEPQTAMSAIGQYDVRVTPLQIAMISATIANGGNQMQPYLVKNVVDSDLDVIKSTDPKVRAKPISGQTADSLTEMMEAVVNNGTGKQAAVPGVQVAGKTGTAQGDTKNAADLWFTGFAPANDPKIALAIVLENGGDQGVEALAGSVAAPAARQIFEAAVR